MARTSNGVIDCRQPVRKTPCCPDCGALECLCRPRFFAGQLLSEQDLNRLDQYIRNKNRLHNRNQHGWGVVNGLLVVCDPCGDVKVTQGYAVDPCGDDIVVCEDTRVNICDLIRKCRQVEPQPECQPFRQPPNSRCDEVEEEWVLTIKYHEWTSRGVTALRGNSCGAPGCASCNPGGCSGGSTCDCGGASVTGSGCSCASCGSSGGSCGCSGKGAKGAAYKNSSATATSTAKNRGAPEQCEPTVTCEGYSFGVYKKPAPEKEDDDDRLFNLSGAFWDAFTCCARPLLDAIPPMPDLSQDGDIEARAAAVSRWCCQFRDNLLKYFLTHRNTSCEIIDHLRAINCPNVNSPNTFVQDFTQSFLQLLAAWAEGLKNCLCLSLLPPPPQTTCDVRVPLATVRIRARDCHILSICNWSTERKIMVTWPAMAHWLGIVPIGDFIRELLDRLCCNSLLDLFDNVLERVPGQDYRPLRGTTGTANAMAMTMDSNSASGAGAPASAMDFASAMHLASGSLAGRFGVDLGGKVSSLAKLADGLSLRGSSKLELGAVLNAVSPRFKLPDNGQKLNTVEAKNLPLVVMSEVMVKPVLGTFLGSGKAAARVAEFQRSLGGADSGAKASNTADVQAQLDAMGKILKRQDAQIKNLQKKVEK